MGTPGEVTRLLGEIKRGNQDAFQDLLPLVYAELHSIAERYFRRERRDHTLQPTALVHEAYLRLAGQDRTWESHLQFLGVAAIMMRRVLVDHARAHATAKRGSDQIRIPLEDVLLISEEKAHQMLAIDEALTRLAAMDPKQARLVELRFFAGLSIEEAAEALQISPSTANRQWNSARAWLYKQVASHDS
ncbi:MAG: sigma-70 family RNA polymerase sigma factor [Acidobacteriaceae bacterium]|nr:sigma-70 family RNA polymerase sigma factor [Acidobacteriaceae bacterium]